MDRDPSVLDYLDAESRTALINASRNGHLKVVRALLQQEANVNAAAIQGRTALIYASREGHLEVVRVLLQQGANVNTAEN